MRMMRDHNTGLQRQPRDGGGRGGGDGGGDDGDGGDGGNGDGGAGSTVTMASMSGANSFRPTRLIPMDWVRRVVK